MTCRVPTYRTVQDAVRRDYGFLPKTCWIADVKERMGFPMREAPNRHGADRTYPCPESKREVIAQVIRRLMGA